ncbi:MAG: hypothetical protein DMG86_07635, partial [Acidobacteria bacterium]
RGGYGIFYVREDVGTVDQLWFTTPILPITTPTGTPGDMADVFAVGPGRLPQGGVIDPAFIPVYSQFLGFVDCTTGLPTTDTSQCSVFDNGQPNPFGVFGGNSINLFGLEVPRHFVSPSTQQWNLSIQRQLPFNWVLEVGYVGTKGTHLRETRDGIQPFDARTHPVTVTAKDGTQYTINQNTFFNANARSRALGLATQNYQIFASDAWSNYHSLQMTASHRFSKSLYFQAAYTWSKALDATSTGNTAFNSAINDQTNLRDSYGPADFDRTQRLVMSYNWDLPFLSATEGWVGALLSRWTLSGITTFQSGTPITIIDAAGGTGFNLSSPGTSTATLNPGFTMSSALASGDIHQRINGYFDPAAFSGAPTVGPNGETGFGNLRRNTFRGPSQQNFKFAADFFNILNHPIFASPNNVFNGLGFGTITSTKGTPRLIQLSGRFSF